MSTEQQIQTSVIKYLESIGCYVIKVVTANKSGVPDLHVCIQGRWLSIEMKKPGFLNTLSPLQKFNLDSIVKAGGLALVATSVTQVQDFLAQHNLIQPTEEEI